MNASRRAKQLVAGRHKSNRYRRQLRTTPIDTELVLMETEPAAA